MSELEEARFFYELVLGLYRDTNGSNNLLNEKLHNVLTITGTVTLILIGLFYYVLSNIQRQFSPFMYQTIVALVVVGLLFLFVSILLGLCSYKSWTFKGFKSRTFADKHYGTGLLNALEHATINLIGMTEVNQARLEKKALLYHVMLFFVALGILSLLLGFINLVVAN